MILPKRRRFRLHGVVALLVGNQADDIVHLYVNLEEHQEQLSIDMGKEASVMLRQKKRGGTIYTIVKQ